jgi:SSS family solute:Na+ symporter
MFWKRTTGHGAFFGLVAGTTTAALFHGVALSTGSAPGIKGGWIARWFEFHSEMGQNFYMAVVAWTTCFVLTIAISLATRRTKSDEELRGLVYSLTEKPSVADEPWYYRPVTVGVIVLAITAVLNVVFW